MSTRACRVPPDRQGTDRLRGMPAPLDPRSRVSAPPWARFAASWSGTFPSPRSTTGPPSAAIQWRTCSEPSGPRLGRSIFTSTRWRRTRSSAPSWRTGSISGSASSTSTARACPTRRSTTIPVELYCGSGHPLFDRAPHGLDRNDVHEVDLVHRAYLSERQVAPLTGGLESTAAARQIEGVSVSSSCRTGTSVICPLPTPRGGWRAGACEASCQRPTASTRSSSW